MATKFKAKLAPSIATAIVFPILMALGFWQLDRAELKQEQLDKFKAQTALPAVQLKVSDFGIIDAAASAHRKYSVTGQYDSEHSFLLDNRVHKSQIGYYVITPFKVDASNKVVLVNRGWIKGKRYRSDLPEFETTKAKISLKGLGYTPSKNFFAIENVKIDTQSYPIVIQNIDFMGIQQALTTDVYPFTLRLDPDDKTGFVRDWKVITSSPEKSQSYAAQWFTMALVVIIIFLSSCFNFKREKTA